MKIKLLQYLLKNIFKYNKEDCFEKYFDDVTDDIRHLLRN